ncbi:uncharacterized protein LOC122080741 isoform X1 [Macadamia integrifolia]|uniref:uncharacterized protein LOC122080741 isoform X1 n=1 Tax=Macadamia integrifolia TaxID=60698 RepID=UPI001C4EC680|nr:uncharacterized protein LOC122080741 isoform X1 [Macadamia integrifolia]
MISSLGSSILCRIGRSVGKNLEWKFLSKRSEIWGFIGVLKKEVTLIIHVPTHEFLTCRVQAPCTYTGDFTGYLPGDQESSPTVEFPSEDWWVPNEFEHDADCTCEDRAAWQQ